MLTHLLDLQESGYQRRNIIEPTSDRFFPPVGRSPLTPSPPPSHWHVGPYPRHRFYGRPCRSPSVGRAGPARPRGRALTLVPGSVWAEIPHPVPFNQESFIFPLFPFPFYQFHIYLHMLIFYAPKMIQTLYEPHKMIMLGT
jgi:hypothetical protein